MPLKPVQRVNIPPVKQGAYLGICTRIIDLGEQRFQDKGLFKPRVSLMFELCGHSVDRGNGEEPRAISFDCNLITYKKADKASEYRKMIESWLDSELSDEEAVDFQLRSMLGEPAELLIAKEMVNGEYRNKITSFSPVELDRDVPEPRMELIILELPSPDDADKDRLLAEALETMKKLPEWQQERIKKSNTWAQLNAGAARVAMPTTAADDAPF
ncbi:MAG: hypothetical protein LBH66_08975 [Oscillospiraceae bacterium]|nr:hypothetical protein [Oscillospiraceae bacterium]